MKKLILAAALVASSAASAECTKEALQTAFRCSVALSKDSSMEVEEVNFQLAANAYKLCAACSFDVKTCEPLFNGIRSQLQDREITKLGELQWKCITRLTETYIASPKE